MRQMTLAHQGESHVRICERLEVKLLRPVRPFGMKAHIGLDSKEGIAHSVCSTAASVSDVHMLPDLLHGGEK